MQHVTQGCTRVSSGSGGPGAPGGAGIPGRAREPMLWRRCQTLRIDATANSAVLGSVRRRARTPPRGRPGDPGPCAPKHGSPRGTLERRRSRRPAIHPGTSRVQRTAHRRAMHPVRRQADHPHPPGSTSTTTRPGSGPHRTRTRRRLCSGRSQPARLVQDSGGADTDRPLAVEDLDVAESRAT
jgi:hypothetical protein